VVTPQVTSIQTAYSFLKGAVLRTLQHHAEKADELELLAPAAKSGENEKVSQILARIKDKSPALAEAIDEILIHFGAQIVGNQLFDNAQAGIFHAISRMIGDFLGITVPIIGTVRASKRIRESVNLRKPMMLGARDEETRAFTQIAEALLAEDVSLDDLLVADSGAFDTTPVTDPAIRPVLASVPAPGEAAPAGAAGAPGAAAADPANALLNPYMRKSPRIDVDWTGSLRDAAGALRPVRIFEVSEGGAVVQPAQPLDLGEELTLVFDSVTGRPEAPVRVCRPTTLGFAVEGHIPATVTAAAAARPASAAPRLAVV